MFLLLSLRESQVPTANFPLFVSVLADSFVYMVTITRNLKNSGLFIYFQLPAFQAVRFHFVAT
jgi:hypothetical protein